MKKFDFVILGATGMQGKIVTKDLSKSGYSVLMCGRDKSRILHLLKEFKKTSFEYFDAKNFDKTVSIIKKSGAKVVVNCVEGDWNLEILKICVKAGVHSIDLGSDIGMTENQLRMNRTLRENGLIHITGCGSVPGIGNVMLRYAYPKFDEIDTVKVGFAWDSNMKVFVVPFSIQSITEEFTMIAPYRHNNQILRVKPMDSIENVYHRAIGMQKQFKVGHHPETLTFYNYCKKKGAKNIEFYAGFPEHSMKVIQKFIDLGFNKWNKLNFNGKEIASAEFLTALLKGIKMPQGYTETENLWVILEGKYKGKHRKILMECVVPPMKDWEDAGCNIDTGMPASIIAQMIYKGIINKPGSYSPEDIVPVEPFFQELRKRKMLVYENGKVIN